MFILWFIECDMYQISNYVHIMVMWYCIVMTRQPNVCIQWTNCNVFWLAKRSYDALLTMYFPYQIPRGVHMVVCIDEQTHS